MKNNLVFLSFVVACYCSPANAMFYYFLYKGARCVLEKANFSSESDFTPNNFSSLNVQPETEKKYCIIDAHLNDGTVKVIDKKRVEVIEELPKIESMTFEIVKIEQKVVEVFQEQTLCPALIELYNLNDESPDEHKPLRRRLDIINWKIALREKGEKINLDLLDLELKTVKKMYNKDIPLEDKKDIKKMFTKIKELNLK